jgi:hypothetical protein
MKMAIKMTKKEIVYLVINSLVILTIGLGLFVYFLLPELSDFRNSIYGSIVYFLILVGIILCVTVSRKISMPLLGKITVWGYGLLFILLSIFDFGRIEMLFLFIYSVINVCITIFLYQKYGVAYKSIWLFGVLSYFTTIVVVLRVKYLHGELNSTFLWSAILVSIIIFVPCLIYGIRYFKLYRDWEKLIGLPLAVLLGGFVLTWLTVASMNVYLDTSAPTYEEYTIIDKDVKAGSRQVTTYELEVKKDDTVFTIGVSEIAYCRHEVNDTIKLSVYNGAFNEPYYIHENNGS